MKQFWQTVKKQIFIIPLVLAPTVGMANSYDSDCVPDSSIVLTNNQKEAASYFWDADGCTRISCVEFYNSSSQWIEVSIIPENVLDMGADIYSLSVRETSESAPVIPILDMDKQGARQEAKLHLPTFPRFSDRPEKASFKINLFK